jgi:glyoxylase-like metal-dependent hydrolase (beta-lactamase superfamily II)
VVVGAIEIIPLVDAIGDLGELEQLFPDTTHWAAHRESYAELFAASHWRVPCSCYLLRSGGVNVLVDTGVGPAGSWDEVEFELEEGLPAALEAAGAPPPEIGVVFLTHLHIDHVGWNTDREGRLVFPNARYVAHRDGIAFARESGRAHTKRTILPVPFEELEGEHELAPGVTAFPLPGHFPGHMGVRVESGGQTALLIADAAVHPMLLDRPEDVYVSDVDSAECAATRRALLPLLVDQDVLTVCGHYPDGGIGRVASQDGRIVWTAVQ